MTPTERWALINPNNFFGPTSIWQVRRGGKVGWKFVLKGRRPPRDQSDPIKAAFCPRWLSCDCFYEEKVWWDLVLGVVLACIGFCIKSLGKLPVGLGFWNSRGKLHKPQVVNLHSPGVNNARGDQLVPAHQGLIPLVKDFDILKDLGSKQDQIHCNVCQSKAIFWTLSCFVFQDTGISLR